jgi:hypothetical protein
MRSHPAHFPRVTWDDLASITKHFPLAPRRAANLRFPVTPDSRIPHVRPLADDFWHSRYSGKPDSAGRHGHRGYGESDHRHYAEHCGRGAHRERGARKILAHQVFFLDRRRPHRKTPGLICANSWQLGNPNSNAQGPPKCAVLSCANHATGRSAANNLSRGPQRQSNSSRYWKASLNRVHRHHRAPKQPEGKIGPSRRRHPSCSRSKAPVRLRPGLRGLPGQTGRRSK